MHIVTEHVIELFETRDLCLSSRTFGIGESE
jgi:hypothetical protein